MIKYLRQLNKDKVEKSISNITDYINQLEENNQRLQDKINKFNKDDEIGKYRDKAIKSISNSLLHLSELEHNRIVAFRQKHYKECGNCGDFEYRLIGNGIGTDITIKCPICMSAENVTDIDSW